MKAYIIISPPTVSLTKYQIITEDSWYYSDETCIRADMTYETLKYALEEWQDLLDESDKKEITHCVNLLEMLC